MVAPISCAPSVSMSYGHIIRQTRLTTPPHTPPSSAAAPNRAACPAPAAPGCRTRSRVTPSSRPTSSSVRGRSSKNPKRSVQHQPQARRQVLHRLHDILPRNHAYRHLVRRRPAARVLNEVLKRGLFLANRRLQRNGMLPLLQQRLHSLRSPAKLVRNLRGRRVPVQPAMQLALRRTDLLQPLHDMHRQPYRAPLVSQRAR